MASSADPRARTSADGTIDRARRTRLRRRRERDARKNRDAYNRAVELALELARAQPGCEASARRTSPTTASASPTAGRSISSPMTARAFVGEYRRRRRRC